MKKLPLVCFVVAAVLVLSTSLVSVVGTHSNRRGAENMVASPLFAQQTLKSLNKQPLRLTTTYLGRTKNVDLGFPAKSMVDEITEQVSLLVRQNPQLFEKIVIHLRSLPATQQLLKKYDVSRAEFEEYFSRIQHDPLVLQQEIENAKAQLRSGKKPGQPLSLNTTNPFACVITIIALLPVFVALLIVVLIIATATIVTCLNINNCLTKLTDQLQDIITQELLPA